MPKVVREEIKPFIELNAKEKAEGKKVPWAERYALIKEAFPSVERLSWKRALADPQVWVKLVKDLAGKDEKSRAEVRTRVRQLMGDDYTQLPFRESFEALAGNRSIRHLATKTGLGPKHIFNLKHGYKEPDLYLLEQIAKAFNKHPSYFLEYRILIILGAVADQMEMAPEISVDLYRRLHGEKT